MNFTIDNLFTDDLNGLLFSIMGMLIVFFGLAVICLYVIYLPKILGYASKWKGRYKAAKARQIEEERQIIIQKQKELKSPLGVNADLEILLAIATAYHLEENMMADNQKITWKYDNLPNYHWKMSGCMRSFSLRKVYK